MDKIYYFETIEECEKQIIDKSIILDLIYVSNVNLFECFTRTVKNIMFFIMVYIITTASIFLDMGFKNVMRIIGICIIVYIVFLMIISWVKFNHNRSYNTTKVNLVDGMIERCKGYKEADCDEWAKKQMLKRFAKLAGIDINWDNAK